jgi:glutamine amidotransferase
MIAIIDYGMGNIHSVQKALQLFGAKTKVTNKSEEIQASDKTVLPGVGAFDDAMLELKKLGLNLALNEYIKKGKPFLGICLGMQLLFEESEEASESKGLGILKGRVKRFKETKGLKVPHMGWNQITKSKNECPLLKDIADNSYVYFCHSYYPKPSNENSIAATTDYGIEFSSVVWQDNVYGVQFHPEKSQKTGLKILENFVNLC